MTSTPGKTAQNPYSPSVLNQMLKKHLSDQFGSFWLSGEIFEHYRSPAGHNYFTLKDSQSGIKCVMFKQKQAVQLEKGSQVIVLGQLTMYTPKGDIQVNVLRVMATGKGDLTQQFIILKQKLQNAGLFESSRKKTIPSFISSLGIITSEKGAALQDILNILKQKNPLIEITVYHTPVQGEDAAPRINHALRMADDEGHDALLLTRGGGSKEDLWAFNDEFLAHQMTQLNTPIISAVGHETDESISDLVADATSITPSAAAQLISGDFQKSLQDLKHRRQYLNLLVQDKLRVYQQQIDAKTHAIEKKHPASLLKQQILSLDAQNSKLHNVFQNHWQNLNYHLETTFDRFKRLKPETIPKQQQITTTLQQLNQLIDKKKTEASQNLKLLINDLNNQNPLDVLARGYSITTKMKDGSVINDVSQVKSGDEVVTRLKSGRIHAKIFERLEK